LACSRGGGNGDASTAAGTGAGAAGVISSAGGSGTELQAASIPRIAAETQNRLMLLILLEALLALAALVFIVWWTMFAGRHKGEPTRGPDDKK